MLFSAAVEGPADEAALRKMLTSLDCGLGQVYGREGKGKIIRDIQGYNNAARYYPWIVLVDLDKEDCLVTAKHNWLPNPSTLMCFRIAIRELESWLLADRERFASYFAISIELIPNYPDTLPNPKLTLINLVRRSRRSALRADVVPDQQLGQSVGPAYTTRMIEFIRSDQGWRPSVAAQSSPSLLRALKAIAELKIPPKVIAT